MVFYLLEKEKQKIITHYQKYEVVNTNPNIQKIYKYNNITITLYKDKVLFQGSNDEIINEYHNYWYIFDEKEVNIIGNDEVGTGDYFGPIVVTSCYIKKEMIEKLRYLSIKDSKSLNDEKICQLAIKIMKIVIFKSVVISNLKYNQWIEQGYNANVIKALAHNQVLLKMLEQKIEYKKIIIDQFVDSKLYFNYLKNINNKVNIVSNNVYFEIKSENKYLAVACAAIISRYLFLHEIQKIKEAIKLTIPLGAGKLVDDFFINNKNKLPKDLKNFLLKNTKYHFANTKKILHNN